MNITMTVTADTPAELFSTVKGCAALIAAECPTATPDKPAAPANPTIAPATQSTPGTAAPSAPAPAAPTVPVAETAAAPAQMPPVPLADAPTYKLDDITTAGADLAQAGKTNELVALLGQFGVQACTQLKPEQFGAFATALRGLGAAI